MGRITVYDTHGTPGTIEEGDTVGSTFTPEQPGLFQKAGEVYTNVVDRPAAAVRGFLQALPPGGETPLRGYVRGSTNPETIPTFQSQALNAYYEDVARRNQNHPPTFAQVLGGMVPSAAGMAADVGTTPFNALLGAAGQLKPIQAAGEAIAGSPGGRAVSEFLTKKRRLPDLAEIPRMVGSYTKALASPGSYEADIVGLAQKSRGQFKTFTQSIGPAYRSQMQALPGQFDATQRLEPLLNLMTDPKVGDEVTTAIHQAAANAAKVGDTTLQKVLANPDLMKSLTPYEYDQIATTLGQTQSALRFASQNPNVASSGAKNLLRMGDFDKQLGEISRGIESDITALHPQAYPGIKAIYGGAQQARSVLTPEFAEKGNRLFTNIKEGFGGGEVGKRLEQVLPPQTVAAIQRVHRVEAANPREIIKKVLFRKS